MIYRLILEESSRASFNASMQLGGRPVYVLMATLGDNGKLSYNGSLTSGKAQTPTDMPFVDEGELLMKLTEVAKRK